MTVKEVKNLENSTVELNVEVKGDEFKAAVDAAFKKNLSKMNVPGFRKGKAPRKVVERLYGEGIFFEDAVNELYQKLKDEIMNQKSHHTTSRTTTVLLSYLKIIVIGIAMQMIITLVSNWLFPGRGYYQYDNHYYYYQTGSWYKYNEYYGWSYSKAPEELREHRSDYFCADSYESSYGIDRFEDSTYYEETSSSDSDWSSSDSWDSSSTDWSSDW